MNMIFKIVAYFACINAFYFVSAVNAHANSLNQIKSIKKISKKQIEQCIYVSAIGDALGRVTEFIKSTQAIFDRYPHGVRNYNDFKESDWGYLPTTFLAAEKIAPYTDDTCTAMLVIEVLIRAKKENWSLEKGMQEIARAFIKDKNNKEYGWAANYRAPGLAVLKGINELEGRLNNQKVNTKFSYYEKIKRLIINAKNRIFSFFSFNYYRNDRQSLPSFNWDIQATQAGGCGSVMRAYPFGLIFADDPRKAELWAVEQSKMTHGHPWAFAACAAMVVGIIGALQEKDLESIFKDMIEVAKKYDSSTAAKMENALQLAHEAKQKLEKFDSIYSAMQNKKFRSFHEQVFQTYQGWRADDAIAATVYVFSLFPHDIDAALFVGVNTPGDSDSIASMAGALVGSYSSRNVVINPSLVKRIEDSEKLQPLSDQIIALYAIK